MDFREILNEIDAASFLSETNGLHDGYIVSVYYLHQGLYMGNPMLIDPEKTKLVLRVIVTSIYETLIEIVFEGIKDLQIKNVEYELLDSSVSLSKDGFITWCGDLSTEPDYLRDSTYVVARAMKWRIVSP